MERTPTDTQPGFVPQGNPFFRSLNQSYGEGWHSTGGVNPMQLQETPEYKDLVSTLLVVTVSGRERNRT